MPTDWSRADEAVHLLSLSAPFPSFPLSSHTADEHVGPFHPGRAGQGEAGRRACPLPLRCAAWQHVGSRRAAHFGRIGRREGACERRRSARGNSRRVWRPHARANGRLLGRPPDPETDCSDAPPWPAQAAHAAGRSAEQAKQSTQSGSAHVGDKAQGMGEARAAFDTHRSRGLPNKPRN